MPGKRERLRLGPLALLRRRQLTKRNCLELFPEQEQAEAFIAEVEADEPETAALLRVEPIELEAAPNRIRRRRASSLVELSVPSALQEAGRRAQWPQATPLPKWQG
jgi:hypothetical protein